MGHTHDDVDQFFSKINAELLRRDIFTINDLHTAVKQSFNPTPVCIHLSKMGMFVPWLLEEMQTQVEGTSFPHCFLFKRGQSGKSGHFYRQLMQTSKYTTLDSWFPANNPDGYDLFKPNGIDNLDFGKVPCVPFKPADIKNIGETVESMQFAMSAENGDWWSSTLGTLREEDENTCKECSTCRLAQKECVSNKKDDDIVRKDKASKSRQQTKFLRAHILSTEHEVYDNWMPSSRFLEMDSTENQGHLLFFSFNTNLIFARWRRGGNRTNSSK